MGQACLPVQKDVPLHPDKSNKIKVRDKQQKIELHTTK
jgi:hypothetical protein